MDNNHSLIGLLWRGCAMGIAEVIPGVSGGTIAFITGIYERLLNSISSISPELFRVLIKDGFKPFAEKLDLMFIIKLVLGMIVGVVIGIVLVTKALESTPTVLWAFFFGLILASVFYMLNQVVSKNIRAWVLFAFTAVLSYLIVNISPATGSEHPLYIFTCGAIAICALILPGVSGSFMLLILGMYTFIIPKLKSLFESFSTEAFIQVTIFAVGCIFGLLAFSKILKYTFNKYRDNVIMALSGLMLGSLSKIWPWRNPILVIDKANGEPVSRMDYLADPLNDSFKLISEQNVLPSDYIGNSMVVYAVLFMLVGFSIVIFSMLIDNKTSKS